MKMIIKRVKEKKMADTCDILLEKLILDEKQYDCNLKDNIHIKNYFSKMITNEANYLLAATIDSQIVGYIFLKEIEDPIAIEKSYLVDGLYVEENYRHQGIASALITKSIDIIKEKNIKYVDINTMYSNNVGMYLYKKYGFKEFRINLRKCL